MSSVSTGTGTEVFQVRIKATPEAVWQAITDPGWNGRYGYLCRQDYELSIGGAYRGYASPEMAAHGAPSVILDGEILEYDPPRRLVQTWRALWSAAIAAEGARRVTWEIEPGPDGVTTLTLTHELANAPVTRGMVTGAVEQAGGGWPFVLESMRKLLETGSPL